VIVIRCHEYHSFISSVLDAQPNPGEADIEAYIRNLVGCDIQGRDANGNCIRPNDQAGELIGTATNSVNAVNSQGSKGKSSGPPIGIIAGQLPVLQADLMSHSPILLGCAAAVVIVAIIAAVVVRRNNSRRNLAAAVTNNRNTTA
jgi:hypothetical protein